MKVYLVESFECDWDTYTLVDGVFVSADLAEKFIRQRYSMVTSSECCDKDSKEHFYGYRTTVPDSEIHQNKDGDYYYNAFCEYDQEWYRESIGNPYSLKIKEIDVIEVLDDLGNSKE